MKKTFTIIVASFSLFASAEAARTPEPILACPSPQDIKDGLEAAVPYIKEKISQKVFNRTTTGLASRMAGDMRQAVNQGTLTLSFEGQAIVGTKMPVNGLCSYSLKGHTQPIFTFRYQ